MSDTNDTTSTGGEGPGNPASSGHDAGGPVPGADGGEGKRPSGLTAVRLGMFGDTPGVHEGNVHGSVIDQTVNLVESYMQPDIAVITEPGSDVQALAVVSKEGLSIVNPSKFDDYRKNPRARIGTAKLLDLDSFIQHVLRFSDDNTAIFANNDRSKPALTAVLDYHPRGADSSPAFGRHRSTFAFPLSDEWQAWNEKNKVAMPMAEFAAFLEDRIIDVLVPAGLTLNDDAAQFVDTLGGTQSIADPIKLMEVATSLQVNEASVIAEAVTLASGEGSISFQSEHRDASGGKLLVPRLFVLGVPVFRNGERYQVLARLRYRKTPNGLVFFYELWRVDRVFDHAFNEAVSRVEAETSAPVYLGSPEQAA